MTISEDVDLLALQQRVAELEQQLAECRQVENFGPFFQHAMEMLCVAGFDGYFKQLNPRWEQVLGFSQQELMAQPFIEFIHPDDRAATAAEAAKIGQGATTISFENRYRCKDGSYRQLVWTARPDMERGLICAIAHDVTERKCIEAALAESEQHYRTLIGQLPIGLALCHMNGDLVDVNRAYADILGRTIEETLQLSYWDITPQKYAAQEEIQVRALQSTGRYGPYEKEYMHKDGHLVPVRLSGSIIERGGKQFIWSSVEDISEQRRTQEALRQAIFQEETIRAQQVALEELSTPLIPITDQIVVMPLIGSVDSRRAQQVIDNLLHGIADTRARVAILDITGVSVVDTQVANAFVRAAQAVKLLGTQVMLTGIRPEVAQTLIGLGVDLGGIITRSSLQSGVTLAMAQLQTATVR
jgi:rsbT co-antagonist protein RsbR